jgi:hypothetical protein
MGTSGEEWGKTIYISGCNHGAVEGRGSGTCRCRKKEYSGRVFEIFNNINK